ncbi:MAG: cob(I)yrinic acid a,c-diamide adenosyltransferase [Lachnospiraceae bacterium]|nr:cob(I)yrinic acid a,c-diamide adenosyltransferase [Lachnospiraceae bacterium]
MIHLYYGEGKGKTTAAAGQALRAAGNGMKVVFTQFLKGSISGEINILKNIEGIVILRNDRDMGFLKSMSGDEIKQVTEMHNNNFRKSIELIYGGKYDMLVLDEICAAYEMGVIDVKEVESFISSKPNQAEIILTGRNPADIFMESADYITEMCKIRHPFDKNVQARRGIEY